MIHTSFRHHPDPLTGHMKLFSRVGRHGRSDDADGSGGVGAGLGLTGLVGMKGSSHLTVIFPFFILFFPSPFQVALHGSQLGAFAKKCLCQKVR